MTDQIRHPIPGQPPASGPYGAQAAFVSRRELLGLGATVAAGLGLSPLLAACGSSASPSGSAGQAKTGGTLTMGISAPPDTLDPGATGLALTLMMSLAMFDPLVWWLPGANGTGSRFVPGLAESYTVSPDASVYTFKLRKGVTFHDGTKFDASAVKATYDHVVDPATKSKSGLGALGPYKETRILDPYTAQIRFSEPNASFLHQQAAGNFGIASPTALKKYGPTGFGNHPVGTGPFKFVSYATGDQLNLARNPAYQWGPGRLRHRPGQAGQADLPYRHRRQRPVQRAAVRAAADRDEPAAERHLGGEEVRPVQPAHRAHHRHAGRAAGQRDQAADQRPAGAPGHPVRGEPGEAGQGRLHRQHEGAAVRDRAGVVQLRPAQPRRIRLLRHGPVPAQHLGKLRRDQVRVQLV